MNITWSDAGKGPVDLTLANVQHLAIEAGFVFDVDEAQPLNKRANLQKLFDRFNVNSLTAFRHKFFTYELNPQTNKETSSSRPVWTSKELLNKNTNIGTDCFIQTTSRQASRPRHSPLPRHHLSLHIYRLL
ncbi:hypothetical protein Ndes2437A_g00334 [Nannochloris sp. 'desiccata']|nr:hypothetical protein KSW81_002641 [Chlorella desiccata (nom. nud.)]